MGTSFLLSQMCDGLEEFWEPKHPVLPREGEALL